MKNKEFKFELNPPVFDLFFPQHRIKSKVEILEILMEATRYILVKDSQNIKNPTKSPLGTLILVVDKMSRLFFFKDNKSYSIIFPFTITKFDEKLEFTFQENGSEIEIDNQLIANILSVIKDETFNNNNSLDFANIIDEIESNHNENFWIILKSLLLMEDGYIRYDIDPKGYEEAKKKREEHTHPLHHLDVFYSSKVTLKVGLEKKINEQEFIDFFNIKTRCKYLK